MTQRYTNAEMDQHVDMMLTLGYNVTEGHKSIIIANTFSQVTWLETGDGNWTKFRVSDFR